ncbi:MAG: MBL fold metallo-hydrolase [Acidobacteria bacterium]|nr:MBL fold metallo-hydrolase [Acidobacteriota bacterium]
MNLPRTRDGLSWRNRLVPALVLLLLVCVLAAPGVAQNGAKALADEPACQTLTLAAAGAPAPKDPSVMVLRWTGVSNFELAYRDAVILLDAYYDRPPRMHPIGVTREELKKVNAIFIGHAHSDHISDAPFISERTGAFVAGGPPTVEYLQKVGVPEQRIKMAKGGEIFKFNGFEVRAILGHHNVIPREYQARIMEARRLVSLDRDLTETEKRSTTEVNARGSSDPRIITEGTIGYFFQFDNGFNVMYVNSPGPTTDAQQQLMRQIPAIDVGILPYTGGDMGIDLTMAFVRLFRPRIVVPGHHDMFPGKLDMPTVPLFTAIRDEFPKTKTVAPLYRTPVCINTSTKEVFVGQ